MEEYEVKILKIEKVAKNVKKFVIEKPQNYSFNPGQYTSISINLPGKEKKFRPFTFSSSSSEKNLELIIKIYPSHQGITSELDKLKVGEKIFLKSSMGKMKFQGPGTFIAAGSGITPFISIFRELQEKNLIGENKLIYSNKFQEDIILENYLKQLFKKNTLFILTQEKIKGYGYGRLDEIKLKKFIKDFNQYFYLCGPITFTKSIKEVLERHLVPSEKIIIEGK
jgi:ferredoxin-NADP reductase